MATVRTRDSAVMQAIDAVPVLHEAAELFRKGCDPTSGTIAIAEAHNEPKPRSAPTPGV